MGGPEPSLHRESTDSLIILILHTTNCQPPLPSTKPPLPIDQGNRYDSSKALESLLDYWFLNIMPSPWPIIALIHQGQTDYFNFPSSRQYMAQWKAVQATALFLLAHQAFCYPMQWGSKVTHKFAQAEGLGTRLHFDYCPIEYNGGLLKG